MTPEPVADDRARVVALTEMVLLTEKCTLRYCGRVRYGELTDDANTHWHVRPGIALVPAQCAAVDPTIEAIRALVDEMENAHGNEDHDIPSAWGQGYGTAHREVLGDLRAALGDQP